MKPMKSYEKKENLEENKINISNNGQIVVEKEVEKLKIEEDEKKEIEKSSKEK